MTVYTKGIVELSQLADQAVGKIASHDVQIYGLKKPVEELQQKSGVLEGRIATTETNFANLSILKTDLNNRFRDVTSTQNTQLTKINASEARIVSLESQLAQEKLEKQVLENTVTKLEKIITELLKRVDKLEISSDKSDTISESSAPAQNPNMGDFFTGDDDTKSDT